jgi:hypothetical protein
MSPSRSGIKKKKKHWQRINNAVLLLLLLLLQSALQPLLGFGLLINNAVEGWNSKLNSIIGKQQSDVFLQGLKLKEEAELV